ncbi:MAG: FAD:protein FMN transferase [Calditrichaceae bacterium]
MNRWIFLIIAFAAVSGCSQREPIQFSGQTMGTTYHVKIADETADAEMVEPIKQEVDALLAEINWQMSTYKPDSEISRFNKFESTEPFVVSRSFVRVLQTAIQISGESGGAFDVTVAPLVDLWGFGKKGRRDSPPSEQEVEAVKKMIGINLIKIVGDTLISKLNPETELDFSAIAKGYGVDMVADLIAGKGFKNFMVEIGGEVVVQGLNGENKWKIGVDRPKYNQVPGRELEAVIHVSNAGMATSGDYRNYFVSEEKVYSHTIDPVTARPIINGVASVTVIAPDCMLADAMATAIMVMGTDKGLQWVESKANVEAMIIIREGDQFREVLSSGFNYYLNAGDK